MAQHRKYRLNPETLLYEPDKVPARSRFAKALILVLSNLALSLAYILVYTLVLGYELPKTIILKKQNAAWKSKIEVLEHQLDRYDIALDELQVRDDDVYRNIFGMNPIPVEIRNAGFGGVNRYSYLDNFSDKSLIRTASVRLDMLTKKAYIQSKSFDDVSSVSKRAGDMASCIPAVSPVLTDDTKYRKSSSFGYRSDPISGRRTMHSGFDFAMKPGNPVYATGDGVIEKVSFERWGYGNSILIDHGFGYKTRYAHMKTIYVTEGMKIKRGECLGESGNSGKSTGPHLHYEVIYKGRPVNPYNYFDLEMPVSEYNQMIQKAAEESPNVLVSPHKKRY